MVIANHLHLENPFYEKTISRHLSEDFAEKWYLASVQSLITHNSYEIGYQKPPPVSEFILNATLITDEETYNRLTAEFNEKIPPQTIGGQEPWTSFYTDYDAETG